MKIANTTTFLQTIREFSILMVMLAGFVCANIDTAIAAETKTIRVSYLSPSIERPFWYDSLAVMRAAAKNLGIELDVTISGDANYRLNRDGRAVLNTDKKPDYFVSGFWDDVTHDLLTIAEKRGIKTVLFNTPISETETDRVGHPGEKFKNWILHLNPDEVTGSYQLMNFLLAQSEPGTETSGVIGLGGNPEATVSLSRTSGFRRALQSADGYELLEFVHCNWRRVLAAKMMRQYLQSYPQIRLVWADSDSMALGAIDAIRQAGKTPGEDILIGGFDWSPEALQAIKMKRMAATMGGHILEAAWSLILIYDYHHGIDLRVDPGVEMQTQLELITGENVDEYISFLAKPDWHQVDFRQFSKVHNKSLEKYNFSFKAIAAQLRQNEH